MQDRPTAWELLDAVAELLEETLMPATEGGVRHQARVAANLCRIVQREIETGQALDARETALLADVLGADPDRPAEELSRELSDRILGGDETIGRDAWPALVEIVRGKLSIAKPGYDDFDYAHEGDI